MTKRLVALKNQITEKYRQIANYRRMIVQPGRREDGPVDAQVIELLVQLKSSIDSFCMKCLLAGVRVEDLERGASPEMGDLLMRAEVADRLFLNFFNSETILFGDLDMNDILSQNRPGHYMRAQCRRAASRHRDSRDYRSVTVRSVPR